MASTPSYTPTPEEFALQLLAVAEQDLFHILSDVASQAKLTEEQIVQFGPVLKSVAIRAFGLGAQVTVRHTS